MMPDLDKHGQAGAKEDAFHFERITDAILDDIHFASAPRESAEALAETILMILRAPNIPEPPS